MAYVGGAHRGPSLSPESVCFINKNIEQNSLFTVLSIKCLSHPSKRNPAYTICLSGLPCLVWKALLQHNLHLERFVLRFDLNLKILLWNANWNTKFIYVIKISITIKPFSMHFKISFFLASVSLINTPEQKRYLSAIQKTPSSKGHSSGMTSQASTWRCPGILMGGINIANAIIHLFMTTMH